MTTYRSTAWDHEMRNEIVAVAAPRWMKSRFAGTCTACGQRFAAGAEIFWSKGAGAKHAACPKPIEVARKQSFSEYMAQEAGDAVAAAMDAAVARRIADQADELLFQYEAIEDEQDRIYAALAEYQEALVASRRAANFAQVVARKLIYRVSLTGEAKRYGVDVVSLQIVPSAKHGNAKFGELHGEGVGRIERDGRIVFWPNVDQRSARVQAIVAALNVVMAAADPIEFARAYAFEAKQCMRCGDDLVDDQHNPYFPLLGPVCGKKFDREV